MPLVQQKLIDPLHKEGKPQKVIIKQMYFLYSAESKNIEGRLSRRKKCHKKKMNKNQG